MATFQTGTDIFLGFFTPARPLLIRSTINSPVMCFSVYFVRVIPFLNKNVALRSETHRAIWFSAFCAFRGKSRGRDAPPTSTLLGCASACTFVRVIPFLNKNVALRSETHRAIWFSAFCAFRGKSRGRDAPPTATLQTFVRVIPFLNKNVALRSETHRAIWFWAFCAFRGKSRGRDAPPTATLQTLGKSRGRDAPPTATLQTLMSDLLSELVLIVLNLARTTPELIVLSLNLNRNL